MNNFEILIEDITNRSESIGIAGDCDLPTMDRIKIEDEMRDSYIKSRYACILRDMHEDYIFDLFVYLHQQLKEARIELKCAHYSGDEL